MKKENIFLFVFFVIFTLYLRDLMTAEAFVHLELSVSSISQYLSFGLLIWVVLYGVIEKYINPSKTISPIGAFTSVLIGSFIITLCWAMFNPLDSLSTYIRLLLPIFVLQFSYAIIQRIETLNLFFILAFVSLFVLIFTYYENYQIVQMFRGVDESVTDGSYFILYFLPILLCTNKKLLSLLVYFVVFFAVTSSAKRGGIIAITLGLFLYLIANSVSQGHGAKKLLRVVMVVCVIMLIVYLLIGFINTSDALIVNRLLEISDTGGSGRDVIWEKTYEMIFTSDFLSLFLGHGYNQVVSDSPFHLSAHNDFLEIIYDYGMLVFILYILFQVKLIKRIFRMIRSKSQYAAPLVFSYTTFLINSMISHIFIYPQYLVIYTFVWGAILGLYHRNLNSSLANTNIAK